MKYSSTNQAPGAWRQGSKDFLIQSNFGWILFWAAAGIITSAFIAIFVKYGLHCHYLDGKEEKLWCWLARGWRGDLFIVIVGSSVLSICHGRIQRAIVDTTTLWLSPLSILVKQIFVAWWFIAFPALVVVGHYSSSLSILNFTFICASPLLFEGLFSLAPTVTGNGFQTVRYRWVALFASLSDKCEKWGLGNVDWWPLVSEHDILKYKGNMHFKKWTCESCGASGYDRLSPFGEHVYMLRPPAGTELDERLTMEPFKVMEILGIYRYALCLVSPMGALNTRIARTTTGLGSYLVLETRQKQFGCEASIKMTWVSSTPYLLGTSDIVNRNGSLRSGPATTAPVVLHLRSSADIAIGWMEQFVGNFTDDLIRAGLPVDFFYKWRLDVYNEVTSVLEKQLQGLIIPSVGLLDLHFDRKEELRPLLLDRFYSPEHNIVRLLGARKYGAIMAATGPEQQNRVAFTRETSSTSRSTEPPLIKTPSPSDPNVTETLREGYLHPPSPLTGCFQIMYLPMCHWYRQYERLSYAKVRVINDRIEDDEHLFTQIRSTYFRSRGWVRHVFSWWRLRRIDRVKFGLFYSNLVEILDSHLDFRIGSTELKHCFDHPECGKNRTRYRDSLPLNAYRFENPERFKQRLEGLGIRLVEEISILWVLGYCSAYFAVITVFGVVWWICKGDISGGFTAASCFGSILTCVTIALTIFISSKS